MQGFQFDPDLDPDLAGHLIEAAERVGLGRDRVELLGQSAGLARQFVMAVREGYHERFLDVVGWDALARDRERRRASARRAVERVLRSHPSGST